MYRGKVFAALLMISASAGFASAAPKNNYQATILVSNEAGEAPLQDPLLVNAWGIAASPTSPWWVADNGTGMSTLYRGDGTKVSLEVTVPGAPTGMIWYGGSQFVLSDGQPARFMWASEDGTLSGWNNGLGTQAEVVFPKSGIGDPGSIYKGLAIHGDTLYTTDFGECKVESLDGTFTEFDTDGNLIASVATHGQLNSPWGVAMAPSDFGRFGGCLLVGNFGDGRINAYCKDEEGEWGYGGRLRSNNRDLVIDGLWGIGFGNGAGSGPTNTLYFAAGPDDEENGYFGKIEVAQ